MNETDKILAVLDIKYDILAQISNTTDAYIRMMKEALERKEELLRLGTNYDNQDEILEKSNRAERLRMDIRILTYLAREIERAYIPEEVINGCLPF